MLLQEYENKRKTYESKLVEVQQAIENNMHPFWMLLHLKSRIQQELKILQAKQFCRCCCQEIQYHTIVNEIY